MFKQSGDMITWGRVIAFCLRQPLLAERIGLLYRLNITLSDDDYFKDGGWISCRLTSALGRFLDRRSRQGAALVRRAHSADRAAAAALRAHPVPGRQGAGAAERRLRHPEDRSVRLRRWVREDRARRAAGEREHPRRGSGWHSRPEGHRCPPRMGRRADPHLAEPPDAVGSRDGAAHRSAAGRLFVSRGRARKERSQVALARAHSQQGGAHSRGHACRRRGTPKSRPAFRCFPSTVNGDDAAQYWLPSYFTQWYGPSLVLPDGKAAQLDASGALDKPGTYHDGNIKANPGQAGNLYEPRVAAEAELKYGHDYEFRVRLADLTGGGPVEDDDELNDAPATSASLTFRRYVAPKQLTVTPDDPQPAPGAGAVQVYAGDSFTIGRPRLGYPALLFTELDTAAAFKHLLDDKAVLHPNPPVGGQTIAEYRDVSYFDPDVDQMLVVVDVKTLVLDTQASAIGARAVHPAVFDRARLRRRSRRAVQSAARISQRERHRFRQSPYDFGDLGHLQGRHRRDATRSCCRARATSASRSIPCAPTKPALPGYFGFANNRHGRGAVTGSASRCSSTSARTPTTKQQFLQAGLESHQLQALYLQPDPPQVNNAADDLSRRRSPAASCRRAR